MADCITLALKVVTTGLEVAETVKANEQQCVRLAKRVQFVGDQLQRIRKKVQKSSRPLEGFPKSVSEALAATVAFLRTFTVNNWIKHAMNFRQDKEMFTQLRKDLRDAVGDLILWAQICAMPFPAPSPTEDDEAAEKDRRALEERGEDAQEHSNDRDTDIRVTQALVTLRQVAAAKDHVYEFDFKKDIKVVKRMGIGSTGIVHHATLTTTVEGVCAAGDSVACKVWHQARLSRASIKSLRRELQSLDKIRNVPQVVKLLGACTVLPDLCIVMELATCTLADLLYSSRGSPNFISMSEFGMELKVRMLTDVAKGMMAIHELGVLHRDLKSMNLLVFPGNRIKISDFGVAKVLDPSDLSALSGTSTGVVGTDGWTAPEVLDCVSTPVYTQENDVYAFGMVQFEIHARLKPLEGFAQVGAKPSAVLQGKRPQVPSDISPALQKLMSDCWQKKPSSRPTFTMIVSRLEAISKALAKETFVPQAAPIANVSHVTVDMPTPETSRNKYTWGGFFRNIPADVWVWDVYFECKLTVLLALMLAVLCMIICWPVFLVISACRGQPAVHVFDKAILHDLTVMYLVTCCLFFIPLAIIEGLCWIAVYSIYIKLC